MFPVTCPYLLIMCKKSESITYAKSSIEEYKKLPNFTLQWVDAGHDVHMSDPEIIAPYITQFLTKPQAKL